MADEDNIAFQLSTKLTPRGALATMPESTLRKLWLGIGVELARFYARVSDLLKEVHPTTTDELLMDFEQEFELPDPCVTVEQTLEARRAALRSRVSGIGGQSRAYFIQLAASMGITISITEEKPFYVGVNGMGDAIGDESNAFLWRVYCNHPLSTALRETLECTLQRLKPAYTQVEFIYNAAVIATGSGVTASATAPTGSASAIGGALGAGVTNTTSAPSATAQGAALATGTGATASVSAPTSDTSSIKFHPGIYAWVTPGTDDFGPGANISGAWRWDIAQYRDKVIAEIAELAAYPSIKGIQIQGYWAAFEGAAPGDYAAGFAALDAILAACQTHNKRLIVGWSFATLGIGSPYHGFPAYIVDNSTTYGLTNFPFAQGPCARVWRAATMDRCIALQQAYGDRYDGHPNFEAWSSPETGINGSSYGTDGYTNQLWRDQLLRLYADIRNDWPTTALRLGANDLYPDALMHEVYELANAQKMGIGGPDVWLYDITQADRMFAGLDASGNPAYPDRRDVLPWFAEVQYQTFNGNWTLQQIWDGPILGYYAPVNGWTLPTMKPRYYVWTINGGTSIGRPAILAFLATKTDTGFNTKPTAYP